MRYDPPELRAQMKRQKELTKILKEVSKIEERERARLETEAYETGIAVLLSVHHQSSPSVNWRRLAFELPPHAPVFYARNYLAETLGNFATLKEGEGVQEALAEKWKIDEADYYTRHGKYQADHAEWFRLRGLAMRILEAKTEAYGEALQVFQPFSELSELGSELTFKVHDRTKVRCSLRINGQGIIPGEVKSLTAAGKLSVKAMPKGRFHEIYQDYACGCCLRIGREIFALLPVDYVLTTIQVAATDPATGNLKDLPILSALLDRSTMERLNFAELDPSDSMANFITRGDVKVSKKTGAFTGITPLTYDDLSLGSDQKEGTESLRQRVGEIRTRFQRALKPARAGIESAKLSND